jgi:hypothetical protein
MHRVDLGNRKELRLADIEYSIFNIHVMKGSP